MLCINVQSTFLMITTYNELTLTVGYINHFLGDHSHYIVLIALSLLIVSIFSRYKQYQFIVKNGLKYSSSGTDVATQYFYFLKCLTQSSLCPQFFWDVGQPGSLYYPLGLYWICRNISIRNKSDRQNPLSYKCLWEISHYGNTSLRLLLFLNILVFPVASQILLIALGSLFIHNLFLLLLLSLFVIFYLDLYFPSGDYPVQTRSFGYYLSYLHISLCIAFLFFNIDQDLIFSQIGITSDLPLIANNFLNMLVLIFKIVVFTSIYILVFRSSQQGSMFIVSTTFASVLMSPILGISNSLILVGSLSLSIIWTMYYPWLDTIQFFKSHFLNRIHDNKWYLKTYGPQKYKVFEFNIAHIKSMVKSIVTFDINPASSKRDVRYKNSWLSQIFENRCFVYALLILMTNYSFDELKIGIGNSQPLILNLLLFVFASAIVPCFLCSLRIMQGYGPPFHYLDFYSPILWISILIYLGNASYQGSKFLYIFVIIDLLICSIALLPKYSKNLLSIFHFKDLNSNAYSSSSSESIKPEALMRKFIPEKISTIMSYLHADLTTAPISPNKYSVARGHYQMIIDATCCLIANDFESGSKYKTNCLSSIGIPLVDSNSYGYLQHWNWVYLNYNSMYQRGIKRIILDFDIPMDKNWINNFVKANSKIPVRLVQLSNNIVLAKIL